MRFYLGTHRLTWLWRLTDTPLFVSHRILSTRKSRFPAATTDWALDSGGFTELSMHGKWNVTPEEYVDSVARYQGELGRLDFASPQDWMCEPWITAKTGKSVEEHQSLTVENYLTLRELAPDLPFIPVIQGWQMDDYHACVDLYARAGVDLTALPLVGVGSVCRRQGELSIAEILKSLHDRGIAIHGYGVKAAGLRNAHQHLASADSMAWSFGARMEWNNRGVRAPGCEHSGGCNNCLNYALLWRERLLSGLDDRKES